MHIDTSTCRKIIMSTLDVVVVIGLLSVSIALGGLPLWVLGLYAALFFVANYTLIRGSVTGFCAALSSRLS